MPDHNSTGSSAQSDDVAPATIFIVSSAVSGDLQGANLAKELKKIRPKIRIVGAGGRHMAAAGVDVRVQTVHLASVGFIAAFRFYSAWNYALQEQKKVVREEHPDLVILLDSEGYFNECFINFLSGEGIPFIHYFPPLVWLWGPWRAKRIARKAHAIISTFPNEIAIYEKAGAQVFHFGHPLVDIVGKSEPKKALGNSEIKTVGLMPGSRFHEVDVLARPMIEAARGILAKKSDVRFVLPVAGAHLSQLLESEIARAGMENQISLLHEASYDDLRQCDLVVVAAGTATLELTLLDVPMLVVYRVGFLTYLIVCCLVKTPFISMTNILAERRIVPELRQGEVTADRIASEVLRILGDAEVTQRIRDGLNEVQMKLGEAGVIHRVAELVLHETEILRKVKRVSELHRDTLDRTQALQATPIHREEVSKPWAYPLWYAMDSLLWKYLENLTTRYYRGSLSIRRIGRIGRIKCFRPQSEIRDRMKWVLGHSHPPQAYDRLWQDYCEESGLGLIEPILLARSTQQLRHMISLEGEDLLQAALAKKKGVTFLLCHLGPMGCVPAALGCRGYDITMSGTALHRPYYEMKLREMLAQAPAGRAVIGDNLPKRAAEVFRRNGIFSTYVDYSFGSKHRLWFPLGDAELSVTLAGATLAQLYQTPVFYVRCERHAPQKFHVQLIPLETEVTPTAKAGAVDLVRQVMHYLEPDLLKRPGQWWPWDFAQLRTLASAKAEVKNQSSSHP